METHFLLPSKCKPRGTVGCDLHDLRHKEKQCRRVVEKEVIVSVDIAVMSNKATYSLSRRINGMPLLSYLNTYQRLDSTPLDLCGADCSKTTQFSIGAEKKEDKKTFLKLSCLFLPHTCATKAPKLIRFWAKEGFIKNTTSEWKLDNYKLQYFLLKENRRNRGKNKSPIQGTFHLTNMSS